MKYKGHSTDMCNFWKCKNSATASHEIATAGLTFSVSFTGLALDSQEKNTSYEL